MSFSNITIPSYTTLIPVDTRSNNLKVLLLPTASTNQGRILLVKDYYGTCTNSTCTISTTGTDLIDDYNWTTSMRSSFMTMSFLSDGLRSWRTIGWYNGALTPTPPAAYPGPSNPFILLTPSLTFPSYTSPSLPTFGSTYITFPGSSQYLDFGSQALTIGTTGFSVKTKISWTAFNNWARVFDFNTGANGATDMFLTFPGTTPNPLRFQYKESGSEQQTNYGSNFTTNTTYNISVVYNPAIGSTGATTMWVNGTMVLSNTSMGIKATNKTETFTYIGKSSYADGYLAANVYFMGFYQRALTDAEASEIL